MGGIFSSLSTSYTGLQANQLMVDVAGNNISNASDEFYSRQRVVSSPEKPIILNNGVSFGTGVDVESVQRVHNDFVFERYSRAAQDFNFADTEFNQLREVSSYFPDVEGVGIYNDVKEFFNAWKDITRSPRDSAQKQILVEKTNTLVSSLHDTRKKLSAMQQEASKDLEMRVKEINELGSEIARLNREIKASEQKDVQKRANTLRDKRDELEFKLRELIGANVYKSKIRTQSRVDGDSVDFDEDYVLGIAKGLSIIDNGNFHPLVVEKDNANLLNRVYIQGYDFKKVEVTDKLNAGKVGALIDLYNDGHNGTKVGKLQNYINLLDSFARGLIESTNAIYSQGTTQLAQSQKLDLDSHSALIDTLYPIKKGSFELNAYNNDGELVVKKVIHINKDTTIKDVIRQINTNTDDNQDNNTLNDFDDLFKASYDENAKQFVIQPKHGALSLSIKDDGANFAGALGINSFFEGSHAGNIELKQEYRKEPASIRVHTTPADGGFEIANKMQQLQYDKIDFYKDEPKEAQSMKLDEFYQFLTGKIATQTQSAQATLDTKRAVLEATKKEHLGTSQVSVDEEMVNLIKFQGGYAANAKVITTIDKMIDTLLGIKQ